MGRRCGTRVPPPQETPQPSVDSSLGEVHTMKPRAYIETTVISYLSAHPSRDVVIAGHQQVTRDWWRGASKRFELVASQLVLAEAASGDPGAARRRLAVVDSLMLLDATDEALSLAQELVRSGGIPVTSPEDAAHIAIAVANGVEFLVTWNCRHIANAALRARIETVCRDKGYEPAVICTPEELMEPEDDAE